MLLEVVETLSEVVGNGSWTSFLGAPFWGPAFARNDSRASLIGIPSGGFAKGGGFCRHYFIKVGTNEMVRVIEGPAGFYFTEMHRERRSDEAMNRSQEFLAFIAFTSSLHCFHRYKTLLESTPFFGHANFGGQRAWASMSHKRGKAKGNRPAPPKAQLTWTLC